MEESLSTTTEHDDGEDAVRRALCVSAADEHIALEASLRSRGWLLEVTDEPLAAIAQARSGDFRCGAVFLNQPENLSWLEQLCGDRRAVHMEWVALASAESLEAPRVAEFVAERCFDFHTLPVDVSRLEQTLGHAHGMADLAETAVLRVGLEKTGDEPVLVAHSSAMKPVLRIISKFAWSELPVLIGGESGTGKEHVALALHAHSRRADGPFISVNCAAVPAAKIAGELFGYEKGAAPGAERARAGRLEEARGGTILLDEVGELPMDVQLSLLRLLEQGTIERVGGSESIDVDVRIVAASNADLEAAVDRGDFREDLFYRLNVLSIEVPPLRRRSEDIPVLAASFLERQRVESGLRARGFSQSAMRALLQHSWPGNVRELHNRISQAAVLCDGRLITRGDLRLERRSVPRHLTTLKGARDAAERQAIMASLEWADGNVTRAAEVLGVSRIHLYKLLERHGLAPRRGD